ncbi:MAG: anthranilate synthase component 1 [Corynebacterium sp.]|nr:anthranilate synthase component 1 [Corynebacterium sp.]
MISLIGFRPQVKRQSVRYHEDASALFAYLGGTERIDAVLLESADITSKAGIQSVMILKGSVRVTCHGRTVTPTPLTDTGGRIVERLWDQLSEFRSESQRNSFEFPRVELSDERERLKAPSTIAPLRALQLDPGYKDAQMPFIAGGFAFDFLETFEDLPSVAEGPNAFPDYEFLVAEVLLTIDHEHNTAELVTVTLDGDTADLERFAQMIDEATDEDLAGSVAKNTTAAEATGKIQAIASISDADFRDAVVEMQQKIYEGDIYQVVPARSFTIDCPDAFAAYRNLRETNPSPYMFYVRGENWELFGASPESNLKFTATTRMVEVYPIAGTQPRGVVINSDGTTSIDHELDTRAELELRTNAKEVAEHVMLVDLARNDMARVAVPATRKVEKLLQVDRYSRVMHLVSHVTATLADDFDALDAYRACMNMGTLTGAPKLRAMELLRGVEKQRRGSYGGAVGYLRGNGDMDTCIVIRSAFVHNGKAHVQAGAGVVRDSNPQSEANETVHKAYAVLHAIALAGGAQVEIVR